MALEETNSEPSPVVVYWRPGCLYCMRLRTSLRRAHVTTQDVNIWEDAPGAAFVRSVTGGDEMVPTVKMWDRVVVNPSPRHVVGEIRAHAPQLIAPRRRRSSTPRLFQRVLHPRDRHSS